MLAYYTIERHTPKNLTMVNRWWTDKAILCCQQEVEIDFRLHFDPRLWKPLGWKSAETFQEVLNTWFQPDFIWVLFSWDLGNQQGICHVVKPRIIPWKWDSCRDDFREITFECFLSPFWCMEITSLPPPTVAWSLTNEKDDNWCWLAWSLGTCWCHCLKQ